MRAYFLCKSREFGSRELPYLCVCAPEKHRLRACALPVYSRVRVETVHMIVRMYFLCIQTQALLRRSRGFVRVYFLCVQTEALLRKSRWLGSRLFTYLCVCTPEHSTTGAFQEKSRVRVEAVQYYFFCLFVRHLSFVFRMSSSSSFKVHNTMLLSVTQKHAGRGKHGVLGSKVWKICECT